MLKLQLCPSIFFQQVRRCCSAGFVYTELKNGCVMVNGTDAYRVNLDEKFAQVDGFPECEDTDASLAVVGTLAGSELLENGSIAVPESRLLLGPETFCLVNVLENPGE